MQIGIVGTGKVGYALAIGLSRKGFSITGLYNRSCKAVDDLQAVLGKQFYNDLRTAVISSDLVFITVPDGMIERTAREIADSLREEEANGKVFVHCSGALSSEALEPLKKFSVRTASLHPVQTFADRIDGWKGLENIWFGYEGEEGAFPYVRQVVDALKGYILTVKREDKPLYHAAACILSNYTVTLSYMAGTLFSAIGIDPAVGVRALSPLLARTVENIGTVGSIGALTGPISRGDAEVVERHLQAMNVKVPNLTDAYKALAAVTVEVALRKGTVGEQEAQLLKQVLGQKGI